jgi:hypothetical protein
MQKQVAPNAGTRTGQPIRWGAVDYAGSDPPVLGGQVSGAKPAKAVALHADGAAEPGVSLNSVGESGEAVADARRRPAGRLGRGEPVPCGERGLNGGAAGEGELVGDLGPCPVGHAGGQRGASVGGVHPAVDQGSIGHRPVERTTAGSSASWGGTGLMRQLR